MTPNVAASVHQRLLNQARNDGRPFNELLQYYVLERFLYRLGQSDYAERFVLKGALLFGIWQAPLSRPTRDVDLLGRFRNDLDQIVEAMKQICLVPVEQEDGLLFHDDVIVGERIMETADYQGLRVNILATLGNARVRFPVDIGFGDPLIPGPTRVQLPTILQMPPPAILAYSRESVVSEKLHAMVFLGELNSRMKDFYDIWLLARHGEFEGALLGEAISATFAHRRTQLVAIPFALTVTFSERQDKIAQWNAFVRRHPLMVTPDSLAIVIDEIASFLLPILAALVEHKPVQVFWLPGGPWRSQTDNNVPDGTRSP